MAIPYWRKIKYIDDGCFIYQCLNCYNTWESRTAPWFEDEKKRYSSKSDWIACPICRVKWLGKIKEKHKKYSLPKSYGTTQRLYICTFCVIEQYPGFKPEIIHSRLTLDKAICVRDHEREIEWDTISKYWIEKENTEKSENMRVRAIPEKNLPLYVNEGWEFKSSQELFELRLKGELKKNFQITYDTYDIKVNAGL